MSQDNRKEFESMIEANRYDQTTRLIFADWLDENDFPEEAAEQRAWTPEKQRAEDYFREFAERAGLGYGKAMGIVAEYVEDGTVWVEHDSEDARNAFYDCDIKVFWEHYQTLTGSAEPGGDGWWGTPFSCSC